MEEEVMTEKRPIISAGGGPRLEGTSRKTLPMPARYAINAVMEELKADGTFQSIVDKYITAE